MPDFASLESQEVREYWEHEAQEFTPWIASEIRAEDVSELEDSSPERQKVRIFRISFARSSVGTPT